MITITVDHCSPAASPTVARLLNAKGRVCRVRGEPWRPGYVCFVFFKRKNISPKNKKNKIVTSARAAQRTHIGSGNEKFPESIFVCATTSYKRKLRLCVRTRRYSFSCARAYQCHRFQWQCRMCSQTCQLNLCRRGVYVRRNIYITFEPRVFGFRSVRFRKRRLGTDADA